MKKTPLLFAITLLALTSFQSLGQDHKLDLRFGAGLAFKGSGDSFVAGFENELNRNFNSYLSGSVLLGYGTSVGAIKTIDPNLNRTSFLMGSLNAFISPFKNTGKHNFRIGGGYSLVSQTRVSGYTPFGETGRRYQFSKRNHHCFNIIAMHDVKISQKYLVGVKLSVTGNNQMGAVANQLLIRFGVVL